MATFYGSNLFEGQNFIFANFSGPDFYLSKIHPQFPEETNFIMNYVQG